MYGSFKVSSDKFKNLPNILTHRRTACASMRAKPTCFTTHWSPKLARIVHLMVLAKDFKRENKESAIGVRRKRTDYLKERIRESAIARRRKRKEYSR